MTGKASASSGVPHGDARNFLSCYRLLHGREAVKKIKGMLQQKSRDMIIRAMGPDLCIRLELETQGKSVISPRSVSLSTVSWNLAGAVRRFLGTPRSDFNRQFDDYIRKAFGNDAFRNTVLIGDAISSTIGDGTAGHHFRKGDLVETLCCNPQNPKCHFPFLL